MREKTRIWSREEKNSIEAKTREKRIRMKKEECRKYR
jgi:hypothetical protein